MGGFCLQCIYKYDSKASFKNTQMICRIGGVYCILIFMIDKFIRYNAVAVILGYIIIPILGLYFLEKKLH